MGAPLEAQKEQVLHSVKDTFLNKFSQFSQYEKHKRGKDPLDLEGIFSQRF